MKTYIHYGSDKFDANKPVKISNIPYFNKPRGGLWASPVNAEFGWKDWCESECFKLDSFDKSFSFSLKEDAKILKISSIEDLSEVTKKYPYTPMPFGLGFMSKCDHVDWYKVSQDYDGVEVSISNGGIDLRFAIDGWDCDSIVIFNLDCVRVIERRQSIADSVLCDDGEFVGGDEEDVLCFNTTNHETNDIGL